MNEATANASFLSGLFQSVADRGRALVGFPRPEGQGVEALLGLTVKLLAGRGEASGAAIAQAILAGYARLPPPQKLSFLAAVAARDGYDQARLSEAARAYLADPGEASAAKLAARAEPKRQELVRRLNHAPGGTLALVRMREDLLGFIGEHHELAAFDQDFLHLFSSWFNRGFLDLRRIDWTTPANILEKIIRYEAVHAIHGFDDLRRRLEPRDRRLYAFFHPALGDEPLIFVEVALTDAIPAAIAPLLQGDRDELQPPAATTAVFYSISNAQRGLARVSFGNFLIKQVAEDLKRELPRLQNFVTLSPAPGFAAWLESERANDNSLYVTPAARRTLGLLDHANWARKPAAAEAVNKTLALLGAHYLLHGRTPAGQVIDPVARFHLGNGAKVERLNPLGDLSAAALRQSHGLMVNYLYELDQIEKNHEAFANRNEVAASSAVRRLARLKPPAEPTLLPVVKPET